MKTKLLVLVALAAMIAGCIELDDGSPIAFDSSICAENPDAEGCAGVKTPVKCHEAPWDPSCVQDGAGDKDADLGKAAPPSLEVAENSSRSAAARLPAAVIEGRSSYIAAPGIPLAMPMAVRAETGKGPFRWQLEGETYGATISANGRNAAILWSPPQNFAGTAQFNAVFTDEGDESSQPVRMVVTAVISDPMELSGSYYDGPMHGAPVTMSRSNDGNYSLGVFDMSDGSKLMLSVNRLSERYKVNTSVPYDVRIGETTCSGQLCSTIISPMKEASSELQDVAFTVINQETGDMSTLRIGLLVLPKPTPVENTEALCSDGIDNDGDEKIDLADDDCAEFRTEENTGRENTEELCSDGIDNDGDGKIDCEDPTCLEIPLIYQKCIDKGEVEVEEDPNKSKIATAHIHVVTSPDEGQEAWGDGDSQPHRIRFCKDSKFKDCSKWATVRNGEKDKRSCKEEYDKEGNLKSSTCTYGGNLDGILKDKDVKYLDYFEIRSEGDEGVKYGGSHSGGWTWKIDGIKVQYNTKSDPSTFAPRTHYWNPCANEWHHIMYYNPKDWKYKQTNQTLFSKNDTAICAITYTRPEKRSDGFAYLVLPGIDSEVVMESPDFLRYFDGDIKLRDNYLFPTSPTLLPEWKKTSRTMLLMNWGSFRIGEWGNFTGGDWTHGKKRTNRGRGQVESYGDHIFDCNPFAKNSCDVQRKNFKEKGTRPEFDPSKKIEVFMSGPPKFSSGDAWQFGWFSAFVFQPGYVMIYDDFTGSEYIDAKNIYSVQDEEDMWIEEITPESSKVQLTARESNIKHWTENFSKLGSCFYSMESEFADKRCRILAPKNKD